ncbi:MAG: hypothetical protein GEU94_10605, partial [Micromonosporaceae bacterium]|nr:hypothetical protein [Micromonosporaceae bacterium]
MDFVTAALILTWVVLAVLAFGLAGMLRQLRDVQAALRDAAPADRAAQAPEAVRPAGGADLAVVLVADDTCPVCAELAPMLPELAQTAPQDVDVVLVASGSAEKWAMPDGAQVRVIVDRDTMHRVDPGWRPALLAVDGTGAVLAAEPVGSVEQLR